MKKILVMLAMLPFMVATAQNEESDDDDRKDSKDSRNKPHLGVKLGSNLTNIYDTDAHNFSTSSKYGFVGGGFLDIPLGKYVGIHPEVLYAQKGFRANGQNMGTSYDLIRTTSYIDIPLMIAIKPSRFISIVAGPQYSYLINQTDVYLDGGNSGIQSQEFANDDYRKNIFGANLGVDVNIWNLIISGRYGFDVQSNYDSGAAAFKYKNTWLQGTIGFRIF